MKSIRTAVIGLSVLSVLISFASCTRDETPRTDPPPGSDQARISFLLQSPLSLPTRSGGQISDNNIETLDILAFSVEPGGEKYLYSAGAVSIEDTNVDNIKQITAVVLKRDVPQRFVLVANARDAVEGLGTPAVGTDKESLLYPLLYTQKTEWAGTETEFKPIPMWGESPQVTVGDSDVSLEVKLLRMAARVDVYLGDNIAASTFTLSALHVYNANSRGYILPTTTNLIYESGENLYKVDAPTLPPDDNGSDPLTLQSPLSYPVDGLTGRLPSVYLFEAAAATNLGDGVCMIVEGHYKGDASPTYYRLDFATLDDDGIFDEFIPILRNHRYVFNITEVRGEGSPSVDEALLAGGENLGSQLYTWDMGDITDFVFNSNYVLGVSRKEFVVDNMPGTFDLLVTTDYYAGWDATVDDEYEWLKIASKNSTSPNAKDPLVFTVDENYTGVERTGYIVVTAGALTQVITVTQTVPPIVGANTYMIRPGGNTVSIPINWANKDGNRRIEYSDEVKVEYIWFEFDSGLSPSGAVSGAVITGEYDSRKLEVTSGSATGSAVVGVSVNGRLRWSWLIWVTDYDPDNGGTTYSANGYTVMDRFLGANTGEVDVVGSTGFYFQWARKDPFMYYQSMGPSNTFNLGDSEIYAADGSPMYATRSEVSLYQNPEPGIENPTVFYAGARTNDDITLWKNPDGSKGVQDPCPEGWRLPPNSSAASLWTGITLEAVGASHVKLNGLGDWALAGSISPTSLTHSYLGVYTFPLTTDIRTNNTLVMVFSASVNDEITREWYIGTTAASTARCVKEY